MDWTRGGPGWTRGGPLSPNGGVTYLLSIGSMQVKVVQLWGKKVSEAQRHDRDCGGGKAVRRQRANYAFQVDHPEPPTRHPPERER
jgi:hypothetical protein